MEADSGRSDDVYESESNDEVEGGGGRGQVPKARAEICKTPRKGGHGVASLKGIGPGGFILAEEPFIVFELPLRSYHMQRTLRALDSESQSLFWSFHGTGDNEPDDGDIVDVANKNMIPFEGEARGGMFGLISRINHSCSPNARWVWQPQRGRMGESSARLTK